jgi:hypothetical protein
MRNPVEMNRSTIVLARGELAALPLSGGACRVSCVAGRLWVTASGRGEDQVLLPGQWTTFAGRGKIVVEALRTATVRLEMNAAERGSARALPPAGRRAAGLDQPASFGPFPISIVPLKYSFSR